VINTVVGMAADAEEMIHLMRPSERPLADLPQSAAPRAAPHIFGGLKVGITLSMVGAGGREFIASSSGLGISC